MTMNIPGVELIPLTVHEDDRGDLFEVIHASDPFVLDSGIDDIGEIGQVYVVRDRTPHIVRAYHKHEHLHDWFCIVKGSAKFVLVTKDDDHLIISDQCVLTDKKPQLLVVPPLAYHGWMSLEPGTILLSCASHEYDRENPDEHRIPPDYFDSHFGDSPWKIKGR